MKLLLTIGILLTLGAAFGQEKEYTLTINLTDSLSGNPTELIGALGIQEGAPGILKMEETSKGLYVLTLKEGKYAFQFTNLYRVERRFTIYLESDSTNVLLFPDPK